MGLIAQANALEKPIDIVIVLESTAMMVSPIQGEMCSGAKAMVERVAIVTGRE